MFQNLFPGFFEIDPLSRDFDISVIENKRETSVLQVRMIGPDVGDGKHTILSAGVLLGRCISRPGNSRGAKVGDLGSMQAIGYRSVSTKTIFKMADGVPEKVKVLSSLMRDWMGTNMKDVLKGMVQVENEMGTANTLTFMPHGPTSKMVVSVNLANSAHYDVKDGSLSVALWVEEKPGQSKNWYFVLPNMSYGGSDGVVVKLRHGVVISWDGRSVFHCTSRTDVGEGNSAYGCMWSCAGR